MSQQQASTYGVIQVANVTSGDVCAQTSRDTQMAWLQQCLNDKPSGGDESRMAQSKPSDPSNCPVIEAVHFAPSLPQKNEIPISCGNSTESTFVFTVVEAYSKHYPLVLSPDDIWLVIVQGLSQHINKNAETLRSKFVTHTGKKKILVSGDKWGIRPGLPNNNWPGVVSDFAVKIEQLTTGDCAKTITSPFSTTGPLQSMVFRVALMDAMQNYFDYVCYLCCGIPYVQLLGTVEDWEQIRDRVQTFDEYGLGWWTTHLVPLLDLIVRTAKLTMTPPTSADAKLRAMETEKLSKFWNRICNHSGGGSGPSYISGWLNVLFPYSNTGVSREKDFNDCKKGICDLFSMNSTSISNPFQGIFRGARGHVNDDDKQLRTEIGFFPAGLSSAPFILDNNGNEIPMKFVAGFMGAMQDKDTKALRPLMGWCAVKEPDNKD